MKASSRKIGMNYLPVIIHLNNRKETLYGEPLVNPQTARKYAQTEINTRSTHNEHTLRAV